MFIKKVICYDYSYAEYIVSDGTYELLCMDLSVPLPNNQEPLQGMTISNIFVFSFDDMIQCKKICENNKKLDLIIKDKNNYFRYILRAHIVDLEKAIVELYDFQISLENYLPNGFDSTFCKGDYIEFIADRLDCMIENFY